MELMYLVPSFYIIIFFSWNGVRKVNDVRLGNRYTSHSYSKTLLRTIKLHFVRFLIVINSETFSLLPIDLSSCQRAALVQNYFSSAYDLILPWF